MAMYVHMYVCMHVRMLPLLIAKCLLKCVWSSFTHGKRWRCWFSFNVNIHLLKCAISSFMYGNSRIWKFLKLWVQLCWKLTLGQDMRPSTAWLWRVQRCTYVCNRQQECTRLKIQRSIQLPHIHAEIMNPLCIHMCCIPTSQTKMCISHTTIR